MRVHGRWLLVVVLGAALLSAGCIDGAQDAIAGNDTVQPQDTGGNSTGSGGSDDAGSSNETSGSDDGDSAERNRTDDGSSERNRTDSGGSDEAPKRSYPPWPDPAEASVRPGVRVVAGGGQCTSNFLFRTPDNATLMLGVAAHCVAENPRQGDGCDAATEPMEPGTEVTVSGAANGGRLVYSSWWTMQQNNESASNLCRYNDFALIALHPADRGEVHPALMHYGGPTGLAAPGDVQPGDKVLWYGNSDTRQDADELQRNEGYVVRKDSSWSAVMYSATPGVFGDSGSAVIDTDGRAVGLLSTIRLSPEAGSNGVPLISKVLSYANEHGANAELVTWQMLDQGRLP